MGFSFLRVFYIFYYEKADVGLELTRDFCENLYSEKGERTALEYVVGLGTDQGLMREFIF